MYKLYDVGNGNWQIHTRDFGAQEGSFRQVVQYMCFDLDFEFSEIELAVEEMLANDHDAADFGIFRCFIFSHKRKQKNVA